MLDEAVSSSHIYILQSWQDAGRRTPKTPKRRTPSGVGRQFFFGRPTPMASDDGGVRRHGRPAPGRRASDASTNFEKNWEMMENVRK